MNKIVLVTTREEGATITLRDRQLGYTRENKTLWVGDTAINPEKQIISLEPFPYFTNFSPSQGITLTVCGDVCILDFLVSNTRISEYGFSAQLCTIPPEYAPVLSQVNFVIQANTVGAGYIFTRGLVTANGIYAIRMNAWGNAWEYALGNVSWGIKR